MKTVRALVLTGYGLNCDYETDFSLKLAGANSERVHINELIPSEKPDARICLARDSSIGDILLMVPMFFRIKELFPLCRIDHFMTIYV